MRSCRHCRSWFLALFRILLQELCEYGAWVNALGRRIAERFTDRCGPRNRPDTRNGRVDNLWVS